MDPDHAKIFSNPKLIDRTANQFKAALLAIERTGIPEKHREMLMVHCRADKKGLSTGQLAQAVDYPDHKTVNLQYGTLAKRIANELHIILPETPDKKPHWWRALAVGKDVSSESYLWVMRPELVKALKKLNWA